MDLKQLRRILNTRHVRGVQNIAGHRIVVTLHQQSHMRRTQSLLKNDSFPLNEFILRTKLGQIQD